MVRPHADAARRHSYDVATFRSEEAQLSRVASALRRSVGEHGAARLETDLEFGHRIVREVLADDGEAAAALSIALDSGAVIGLLDPEDAASGDPIAALADDVAAGSSLTAEDARWAVAQWAFAVGVSDIEPPDRPSVAAIAPQDVAEPEPAHEAAPAQAQAPNPEPEPEPALEAPEVPLVRPAGVERDRDRRLKPIVLVALGAALVAAATLIVVLALPHSGGTRVSAGTATATVDGRRTAIASGASIAAGTVLDVTSGPLEISTPDGLVRAAEGARIRTGAPGSVTVLRGRVFARAEGRALTVSSKAGTATIRSGALLTGCSATDCRATAIGGTTSVRAAGRTTSLSAQQSVAGSRPVMTIVPDALRKDAWLSENLALDAHEGKARLTITGTSLAGSWVVRIARPDLPLQLLRPIAFSPSCGATGCVLQASTSSSDNITGKPMVGTVVAENEDASRVSVDYGLHPARCQYLKGLERGAGVDGAESVRDQFSISTKGATAELTGVRVTQYTPDGSHCTGDRFTRPLTATLSGSPGGVPSGLSRDQQQVLLNYVVDPGSGCSAAGGAPPEGVRGDVVCRYTAAGPSSVEYVQYTDGAALQKAFTRATAGLPAASSSGCAAGSCLLLGSGGAMRLGTGSSGGELVATAGSAPLLIIASGSSTAALFDWWTAQQRTHSVYATRALPRVGV